MLAEEVFRPIFMCCKKIQCKLTLRKVKILFSLSVYNFEIWKIPTSPFKKDFSSSHRLYHLTILNSILLESSFYEMINYHTLGELGHAEGIKSPVYGVPSLERVVRGDEYCVLFS